MKKITFIALVFALACGKKEAPKTEAALEPTAEISVKTARVEFEKIALPIVGSGLLTTTDEQRPAFKIGGVISKMLVDEGDFVQKGQLLATLDLTEINASVAQARLGVEKSERDLARVESLRKDSAATLELLQNAKTGRDAAAESFKIASFNQKFAEIRAAKSGRVVKKLANAGEVVGPGMPVFVLFSEGANDWALRVPLSDRDWAKLTVGASADVFFDAWPSEKFIGKVAEMPATADPASGLYPIEIRVAPKNGRRFVAGLFAKTELRADGLREVAAVPIEAILEGNGREAYVFALRSDGKSVEKRAVQIAFLEKNRAVVASGLEGVSEVVTAGSAYLNEKSVVRKN